MLHLFLTLAATLAQTPLPMQWAQFGRSGALSGVTETVDIATGERNADDKFPYKLRLTKKSHGDAHEVRWADSSTCPAVRAVIAGMRTVKMPSPAPYGVPGQSTEIIVDGIGYFLSAPSSDSMGTVTITSNVGSSLATWIDASFTKLAPCWKTAAS